MEVFQKNKKISFKFDKKGNFIRLKEIFKNKNISRFAIVEYKDDIIECEYAEIENINNYQYKNIFDFNPTLFTDQTKFNIVQIIPTGIRADVGGNSGDGNPSARLLGSIADTLITHPNVVNAADINEMTSNTLYVEGSTLSRFMMGTIGLAPRRKNKILLIYDTNKSNYYHNFRPLNMASAARVTLGCEIDVIELYNTPYYEIFYNDLGMATGKIENLEKLTNIIEKYKDDYDSFILYTLLNGDTQELLDDYYSEKNMANPWGSAESLLTHTISNLYDIPCAHAPVLEKMFLEYPFEIVDPRKTPEILSTTELFCTIKGMYLTPKIVTPTYESGIITNRNISALVTPDRCIGLPLIAALEQNIPVVAIEDETNLMKNDLDLLPWNDNQFFKAKSYLEAAGILLALKSGISPYSLKRPISITKKIK